MTALTDRLTASIDATGAGTRREAAEAIRAALAGLEHPNTPAEHALRAHLAAAVELLDAGSP